METASLILPQEMSSLRRTMHGNKQETLKVQKVTREKMVKSDHKDRKVKMEKLLK